ncbi:hypothetical protein C2S51_015375 [Perilla frutescens var. frutescens]|nr:hypothetical protein C2S51_015375 [Perilla frutescens var. frutescens]
MSLYEEASDESSMSNCSSWMLEDIEGPLDDDIFSSRPSNHAMEIWNSFRALVKKQKRNEEIAEMENDANLEDKHWFSDDEDELISLRGSDDDTFSHPSWKECTKMENFVMTMGMKFSDRKQFRDVPRDWSVTEVPKK